MKNYIKKEDRKKIIFIGDDIRWHSGVATVSREIVTGTAHHYKYMCLGGSINHPDKGKRFDLSDATNKVLGIDDAEVFLFPTDGYGTPELLREVLKVEKPDAIVFITDPRYYTWLFQMEHEIRSGAISGKPVPLVYINIWDEFPPPLYNKNYYKSCDLLLGISKQTVNINNLVLEEDGSDVRMKYFPHGINHNHFKPLPEDHEGIAKVKKDLFGDKQYDFVLLFNSRNIRRKSIPDTLMAFKVFLDKLSPEEQDKCAFVLHTHPVDDNGTDLFAVREMIFGERQHQIVFSTVVGTVEYMNILYNIADATVLLSSNEGFGLSGAESIMAGTPVIGNVTGGIQDYARFADENGNWFTPNDKVWSNHNKTYKDCGFWFFPVFPSNLSIQGSPPTPYIFDSRCDFRDAADVMYRVYKRKDMLRHLGLQGRKWLMSDEAKMSAEKMCESFIEYVDELIENWEPRHQYEIIKIDEPKKLKHIKFPEYLFK